MYLKFNILLIISFFQFHFYNYLPAQNYKLQNIKHYSNYPLLINNKLNPDFEKYDVKKYEIKLDINPDLKVIKGNVKIQFEVQENNFSILTLNLNGLQIDSIVQINKKLIFNRNRNEINITLNQPLQSEKLDSICVYYHGSPIKGMYFRNSKYNNMVIYTHNEPFDAQYWIPCKDDPSDKSLLDMWITVPQNLKAVSNGILNETSYMGQGKIRYYWQETYPISTYLISVAASDYEIVSNVFNWNQFALPLEYYIYPEDFGRGESAITNTIEMLDFFSDYIGIYPFILEKYAMVEVPFQEAGAMENQTISTMDEPVIDNESVIAHELAHQWWGDAVTPSSFTDIWLNEGFATYFDALFVEHKYGEKAFQERMIASGSNVSNDGSIDYAIYNPPMEYLFGSAVYNKGAWVLHMIRKKLGKEVFKTIIRNYYNNYLYNNVSTTDFIIVCENVSGLSLQKFFDQWVFSSGIPNLFASWRQDKNIVHIKLEQLQDEMVFEFDLEINLKGLTGDTTFTVNVSTKEEQFSIPYPEPITHLRIDPDRKVLNINNGPVYIIPNKTELIQLFPNPFNTELNIFFRVDKVQNIKIELWDIMGKKVKTLQNEKKQIGTYKLNLQVKDLASGTYICVLKSGTGIDKQKIILIK
jgi:aminopeptidase N